MKNILFVVLAFWAGCTKACDICGCTSSPGAMGLLPRMSGHFAGVRSMYARYESKPHSSEPRVEDAILSYEILGRYLITPNWVVTASLPFQSVFRKAEGSRTQYHQLGDASLMLGYLYSFKSGRSGRDHTLYAAAGIKLPTGSAALVKDGNLLPPGLQPGSGSVDWIFMMAWNQFGKSFGMGAESSFRLARPNSDHYSLGNRFGAAAKTYYKLPWIAQDVWASLGLDAELTTPDLRFGEAVDQTGGKALLMNCGLNFLNHHGLNLGLYGQIPLAQNLNNGFTRSSVRAGLQFFYFF